MLPSSPNAWTRDLRRSQTDRGDPWDRDMRRSSGEMAPRDKTMDKTVYWSLMNIVRDHEDKCSTLMAMVTDIDAQVQKLQGRHDALRQDHAALKAEMRNMRNCLDRTGNLRSGSLDNGRFLQSTKPAHDATVASMSAAGVMGSPSSPSSPHAGPLERSRSSRSKRLSAKARAERSTRSSTPIATSAEPRACGSMSPDSLRRPPSNGSPTPEQRLQSPSRSRSSSHQAWHRGELGPWLAVPENARRATSPSSSAAPELEPMPDLYELAKPLLDPSLSSQSPEKLNAVRAIQKLLKATREPPNAWSGPGTPLGTAVMSGLTDFARLLLRARANPNEQDGKGVTPLHLATYDGHVELCRVLLVSRASVDAHDRHGQSPLFFAPSRDVAKLLVERVADVNILNRKGQSALHLAGRAGLHEVLSWLGARVSTSLVELRDAHGITARQYAQLESRRGRSAEPERPPTENQSKLLGKNGSPEAVAFPRKDSARNWTHRRREAEEETLHGHGSHVGLHQGGKAHGQDGGRVSPVGRRSPQRSGHSGHAGGASAELNDAIHVRSRPLRSAARQTVSPTGSFCSARSSSVEPFQRSTRTTSGSPQRQSMAATWPHNHVVDAGVGSNARTPVAHQASGHHVGAGDATNAFSTPPSPQLRLELSQRYSRSGGSSPQQQTRASGSHSQPVADVRTASSHHQHNHHHNHHHSGASEKLQRAVRSAGRGMRRHHRTLRTPDATIDLAAAAANVLRSQETSIVLEAAAAVATAAVATAAELDDLLPAPGLQAPLYGAHGDEGGKQLHAQEDAVASHLSNVSSEEIGRIDSDTGDERRSSRCVRPVPGATLQETHELTDGPRRLPDVSVASALGAETLVEHGVHVGEDDQLADQIGEVHGGAGFAEESARDELQADSAQRRLFLRQLSIKTTDFAGPPDSGDELSNGPASEPGMCHFAGSTSMADFVGQLSPAAQAPEEDRVPRSGADIAADPRARAPQEELPTELAVSEERPEVEPLQVKASAPSSPSAESPRTRRYSLCREGSEEDDGKATGAGVRDSSLEDRYRVLDMMSPKHEITEEMASPSSAEPPESPGARRVSRVKAPPADASDSSPEGGRSIGLDTPWAGGRRASTEEQAEMRKKLDARRASVDSACSESNHAREVILQSAEEARLAGSAEAPGEASGDDSEDAMMEF